MAEPKMGKKSAIENAPKRFEKIYRQPVSKRISDFLKEEGKKERPAQFTIRYIYLWAPS